MARSAVGVQNNSLPAGPVSKEYTATRERPPQSEVNRRKSDGNPGHGPFQLLEIDA